MDPSHCARNSDRCTCADSVRVEPTNNRVAVVDLADN